MSPPLHTPNQDPREAGADALAAAQRTALLADARILLWTAHVQRVNGDYTWDFSIAPECEHSPLLAYTTYVQERRFWHQESAPDWATTEATYRHALATGQDRYQQQFRIRHQGKEVWLDEVVRVTPLAPDEWQLSGLIREITDRKAAENAERRAKEELQRLLLHSQCMLWHASVTETAPGQLRWELSFLPSGLQRLIFDQLTDAPTTGLYNDFDVPQLAELNARALEALHTGAAGYHQEFMITRKRDRRSFWIREHVAILPPVDGRWALSGVMIDVTAENTAELARRDTELQFRHLLEQIDCIVWHARLVPHPVKGYVWDFSVAPSRLFRRLFKTDPVPPVTLWTPDNTPDFAEMDQRWRIAIAANLGRYEQEFRYPLDGDTVWLHENVTVLDRRDDSLHLAGVIVDITARKLAEEQLGAEKERLAVTLRAMDEAVITTDPAGRVTFANRAAELLLGASSDDLLGNPLTRFAVLQAGDPPRELPWSAASAASTIVREDARLVRATGVPLHVEGCIAPLQSSGSTPAGAVIVLRDVTERQLLQTQLQRASMLESVGILAGGIAHDFNNILTALLANLSLAEMDVPLDTPVAGYLTEARLATDRATALARQLLTFAKGGDPLLAAVNLGDVIGEVTRFTLRGTRTDHRLSLDPDLWPARADRGQLAQIIQNLVLNAAQSMPQGGTVRIAARNEIVASASPQVVPPGRYVNLTVADSGSGIPAEALDKIFTPYFTTKASGNGLGLAVVYSIVKKHRGSIDVHSQSGEGTTFELRLPAAPVVDSPAPPAEPDRPPPLRGRVLVMDDEEAILRVTSTFLQRTGLEVETVTDGSQAVARYEAAFAAGTPHDVVVMDLTVPGKMGGREAIAALRIIDPQVCAIVASGYSSDPVLARYRDFGFAAMAAKPYDINQLAQLIADLIRGRRDPSRAP